MILTLISFLINSIGCSAIGYGIGKKIDNQKEITDTRLLYQIGDNYSVEVLESSKGKQVELVLFGESTISGVLNRIEFESVVLEFIDRENAVKIISVDLDDIQAIYLAEDSFPTRWIWLGTGLLLDAGVILIWIWAEQMKGVGTAISSMGA